MYFVVAATAAISLVKASALLNEVTPKSFTIAEVTGLKVMSRSSLTVCTQSKLYVIIALRVSQ